MKALVDAFNKKRALIVGSSLVQCETSRRIFDSSTKDLFTPSSEDEMFLPSQSDINVAAFYT